MTGETIRNNDKIEVPVNEFGIPDSHEFMSRLLDALNEPCKVWGGEFDTHHMAWPGSYYKKIQSSRDERAGAVYRGSGMLKIRMARDLHVRLHQIAEVPEPPEVDVIDQWALENEWVQRLYQTARTDTIEIGDKEVLLTETAKLDKYLRLVERTPDSQLGLLPDRELLASYSVEEARLALRSLAATLHVDRTGQFVASSFKSGYLQSK